MKYKVTLYLLTFVNTKDNKIVRRWKKLWVRRFALKKQATDYANYMASKPERKLALQKLPNKNSKRGVL